MKQKRSLHDEINDFLCLWGSKEIIRLIHDLFPLLELYNVDEMDDWVRDAVGDEDLQNVRLVRTVYLLSKLAETHGPRLGSTNNNFRNLWKRIEEHSIEYKEKS